MSVASEKRQSARGRLLAAADELFYDEGIHAVGIDRVIERAGVAKGSLYYIFGSKDELVRAYLTGRHATWAGRVEEGVARVADPRERLLAVFDVLTELFAEPDYKGCAFLNANGEAKPGGVEEQATEQFRGWLRDLFTGLAAAAGARAPEHLTEQLILLYDGATVASQMDHNLAAAKAARGVAESLVDGAIEATI